MISYKRLEEQMKRINFHHKGWGRSEVAELCNVLMPEEEIEECVNGYYEAGFALLVATKDRVLLVDKKPLGYLTVEDMRFDMINELDLHHRLLGAQIRISAGAKTLLFTSLNQTRLRRLLNYVQARMTQIKHDAANHETEQKKHLEEMNEQLRLYLMAAHKQQFVDQAQAIRTTEQPYVPAPQLAPAEAMNLFAEPTATKEQPRNSFEHAAAAAFDGQQAVTRSANSRPEPRGPMGGILHTTGQVLQDAEQVLLTPQQVGLAAVRRVVPIVSAYTRLPLINRRRLPNQRSDGADSGALPATAQA